MLRMRMHPILAATSLLKNNHGAQAIEPIFNRAILFKSNMYHKGLAPSRFSTQLRITIAFKLREVAKD